VVPTCDWFGTTPTSKNREPTTAQTNLAYFEPRSMTAPQSASSSPSRLTVRSMGCDQARRRAQPKVELDEYGDHPRMCSRVLGSLVTATASRHPTANGVWIPGFFRLPADRTCFRRSLACLLVQRAARFGPERNERPLTSCCRKSGRRNHPRPNLRRRSHTPTHAQRCCSNS